MNLALFFTKQLSIEKINKPMIMLITYSSLNLLFFIMFITLALYQAIVKTKIHLLKKYKYYVIISNILIIVMSIVIPIKLSIDTSLLIIYIILVGANPLYIFFQFYCLYNIRKKIQEFHGDLNAKIKRTISKYLLGYPVVYFLMQIAYLVLLPIGFIRKDAIGFDLFQMYFSISLFYPIFIALVHMIAEQYSKFMFFILLRDSDDDEEENLFDYLLRTNRRNRFNYLDLLPNSALTYSGFT